MATTEQNRTGLILLWVCGLAVALGIVFAIRGLTHKDVAVKVVPVTYQTLRDEVSTNGKVEPTDEFQVHAPGPGVIKRIYVDLGDHVSAGTLLLSMDDVDAKSRVATAKANLSTALLSLHDLERGGSQEEHGRFTSDISSAQIEQTQAAANYTQLKALQGRGAASQAEVLSAQQRLDSANLSLKTAQGRTTGRYTAEDIRNAQAHVADASAALAAAQNAVNNSDIRSPIPGTVYSVPYSQNDYVKSGEEDLLDVADLKQVRVMAYFDEPEIGRLARGQAVKITWDARPGVVWHGHVLDAPTTVTTYNTTRSVGECVVTIDDAKSDLLPNTNVNVTVTRNQRFNVLSVPREALHTDGAKDFVYKIVGDKLTRTPVTTGIVNQTSAEITSGLKDNDIVVLQPAEPGTELSDGLAVKQVQ